MGELSSRGEAFSGMGGGRLPGDEIWPRAAKRGLLLSELERIGEEGVDGDWDERMLIIGELVGDKGCGEEAFFQAVESLLDQGPLFGAFFEDVVARFDEDVFGRFEKHYMQAAGMGDRWRSDLSELLRAVESRGTGGLYLVGDVLCRVYKDFSELTIPDTVRAISSGAFTGVMDHSVRLLVPTSVKLIYWPFPPCWEGSVQISFQGGPREWEQVDIVGWRPDALEVSFEQGD